MPLSCVLFDFNPRSPRGERRNRILYLYYSDHISIHAPREGSDSNISSTPVSPIGISIHAPREGSDRRCPPPCQGGFVFQSTLPARGATLGVKHRQRRGDNFNPRSPRGERLSTLFLSATTARFQSTLPARGATTFPLLSGQRRAISIHAPREGSDVDDATVTQVHFHFNPRSPRGERHWILALCPRR